MRAAIFIDGGYILKQAKYHRVEPDYTKLSNYFLKALRESVPLDLMRCYFYYCPPWISEQPTEDENRRLEVYEAFVEDLEGLDRWAVRQGKLEKRFDGKTEYFEQKRVDVLLSCDLVRHAAAGHIQHAVLVAGDSDFIPAVEAAKDSGVTITLFAGNVNTVHNDLVVLADEVHHFDWSAFPKKGGEKPATTKTKAKRAAAKKKSPKSDQNKKQRQAQKRHSRASEDKKRFDPDEVAAMKKELGFTETIKKLVRRDKD